MDRFELMHERWLEEQAAVRKGESLRRLREGHAHAEKMFAFLWWQAIGHFEFLSAEMEVYDFRDGVRYLDFAYLRPPYRINIEVDAYGTHCRNLSRRDFSDERARQNHLMMDDWKVFRFVYDDINEKPRQVQQCIQQMIGRWYGGDNSLSALPLKQREIMRLAMELGSPFSVAQVCCRLHVGNKHARSLLHELVDKQLLQPASGTQRIHSYTLGIKAHGRLLS
jgi:very-short-patch-repair endonuclease